MPRGRYLAENSLRELGIEYGGARLNIDFNNIVYETVDGVARVSINRPPLNILNSETLLELTMALERARDDPSVFAVLITGSGSRAFSAGVDIKDHLPGKVNSTLSIFNKVFYILKSLDKPTIAVVKGAALGGGCELAIGCDMIVASETAQFGQPEISVGAIPPVAVVLLPRLIGPSKALELILTGRVITAVEARQIGLVSNVVPLEKLDEYVGEIIGKLREKSPIVLKLARMSLRKILDADFKKELEEVTSVYLENLMHTEDAVEGLKAFIEKRKPQWKGK